MTVRTTLSTMVDVTTTAEPWIFLLLLFPGPNRPLVWAALCGLAPGVSKPSRPRPTVLCYGGCGRGPSGSTASARILPEMPAVEAVRPSPILHGSARAGRVVL